MRGNADYLKGIRQRLYTAVLSDVLDELGLRNQAMPPSIRPLDDALVMVGFARTGLYREVYRVVAGENPYELEIALIDDLRPDDIAVFGCGGSTRDRAVGRAADDGLARARRGWLRHRRLRPRHPADPRTCASRSSTAASPRSIRRDAAWSPRSTCRSSARASRVAPGDLIVGDADGVVVVPRAVEAQVVARAFEKVASENRTREELAAGARLKDVFAKYRVL